MSEKALDNIETAVAEDVKLEEAKAPEVVEEVKVEETKAEEVTPEPENVVEAPAAAEEVAALAPVADGAIGSAKVTKAPKPAPVAKSKKAAVKEDKVAIHSERNVSWEGVGKIYRGFNIVSKDAADKWTTRSYVRLATPAEVAKEYGL